MPVPEAFAENAMPMQSNAMPPPYSNDILAPPTWAGPPGYLIPWHPTAASLNGSSYNIYGDESQLLQVVLQPNETVHSEPGALMYMAPSIKMQTGAGGFGKAFKRKLAGESIFQNRYSLNNFNVLCLCSNIVF